MPLGTDAGLGPVYIVLDGNPAHPLKGAQQPPPQLSAFFSLAYSFTSSDNEHLCNI